MSAMSIDEAMGPEFLGADVYAWVEAEYKAIM